MPRYTLIVFDRGVGYPEEMPIIKDLLTDEACCAAQCGPINISQFSSDFTKQEISSRLKENEIEFILTEEENLSSNLPKSLHQHFSNVPKILDGKVVTKSSKIQKVSLEDQLKTAVSKEDYVAAAKIRDEIQKRDSKSENPAPKKKPVKKTAVKKLAKKAAKKK